MRNSCNLSKDCIGTHDSEHVINLKLFLFLSAAANNAASQHARFPFVPHLLMLSVVPENGPLIDDNALTPSQSIKIVTSLLSALI